MHRAFERANLLEHFRRNARRMAARLQNGEHERGELVAARHARKFHARRLTRAADRERRAARGGGRSGGERDQRTDRRELRQHRLHLAAGLTVVIRDRDCDRLSQAFENALQLLLEVRVDHGLLPSIKLRLRSCRPSRAKVPRSSDPESTSPGTLHPGGWRRTARPAPCGAVPSHHGRCRGRGSRRP